jgi:Tfp pilus assembly protein PilN
MIEINLLPKNYAKKSIDFSLGKTGVYAIAAAAGIVLMLIAVTFYQKYQLSNLDTNIMKARQRATMLQKDIKLVDALTDVKNKITERMQAVERLDSHRSAWVRILEDMSRNIPEFVWLGKFDEEPLPKADKKDEKKKANPKANMATAKTEETPPANPNIRQGKVEGFAFTLNSLAAFMIKMMRSDYFDEVELKSTNEIQVQDKKAYNFVLTFNIHYLSDEELRNHIASTGGQDNSKQAATSHKSLN